MELWDFLVPPAFGFVTGYLTNAVAIAMLFRPFEEFRILGLRFQGMIPRRKEEIARSVARIVASDLLKEERVAHRVAGDDVRAAFEGLILDFWGRQADREVGSLRTVLGPERLEAAVQAIEVTLAEVVQMAGAWAPSPEGVRTIGSMLASLLDRSPADLLPGEEFALREALWSRGLEGLAAPDLEDRVRAALSQVVSRLITTDRRLSELFPAEIRMVLLRTVGERVPALLRRFEDALLAPGNVEKIKGAVRSGIREYLTETEGGLLKNVVRQIALLGRERIFGEVDDIVDANLFRLRQLIYEEENRAHLEEGIVEAIDSLLAHTPGELFGRVPTDVFSGVLDQAARWVCLQMRRPAVTEALAQAFQREFGRIFQTSLRELVALSGGGSETPERWAAAISLWAAGGGLDAAMRREAAPLARALMDMPLGRPGRFMPTELLVQLLRLAMDRLMPLLSAKVPEILRIVNVERLIEQEVLFLPPPEVERVILAVAKRELWAITWWGGVLGTAVGALQSALLALRP